VVLDRGQWRSLVNAVMNVRFHKILGISCVAPELVAPQEGFSSMKLVKLIYLYYHIQQML
jgi:hypothetical protein